MKGDIVGAKQTEGKGRLKTIQEDPCVLLEVANT